jgi:hypothetical protein
MAHDPGRKLDVLIDLECMEIYVREAFMAIRLSKPVPGDFFDQMDRTISRLRDRIRGGYVVAAPPADGPETED